MTKLTREEIVRSGVTRLAISILILQSLLDKKIRVEKYDDKQMNDITRNGLGVKMEKKHLIVLL